MALKPYLQLVRLPNVFTAAADPLAGWLLVMGRLDEPRRWLPLLAASMAFYAAGMVLNDLFDLEVDQVERPERPLPSGRVSVRFAALSGVGLLAAGLACSAASGSRASLAVALTLTACIVAYDAGLKHTILGPVVMGACRGLNLLLGASQAPALGGPAVWVVAGALALFVVGVTWISRSETRTGDQAGPIAGWIVQNIALLGLIFSALQPRQFPAPVLDAPPPPVVPLEGLIVLLLAALVINRATGRAVAEPVPERLQGAVKTGVLSLVWLNVGVVAAVRGPGPALAVAALWLPAFVLGRWLYST